MEDEAFLRSCPAEVRREFGVYFTPPEVVRAQAHLVEDVLRRQLGITRGFADERVLVVDPACGGGAYPLAIGVGRMQLYERLPEAAALARQRGLTVQEGDVLTQQPHFDAPVVVCIGNPPYRRGTRRRALVGDFAEYTTGVHLKSLYNEYVYFWQWALKAVFAARPGPGVVCFLTAASYLRGPAFSGMRRAMRRALDELWIVDLEGDPRAARASDNVFSIRTPVAIALGVRGAQQSTAEPAAVHYARLDGSGEDKLRNLNTVRGVSDLAWTSAANAWEAPVLATRTSAWASWPALTDLFPWQLSGAQLKRTWPIGITPAVLRKRWQALLQLGGAEREAAFVPSRDRTLASSPRGLAPLKDLPPDMEPLEPVGYAYRAFDRQWVLPDARLGDFLRPELWRVTGPEQVFLTTMLTNVLGPGPAAIATALVPDLDHFRGSFGARGVMPLWRDPQAKVPNVSPDWLQLLGVSPPELMAYCYALLAAPSFTRRFEDDLRAPGPRVPITADTTLFRRTAAVGQTLMAIHTHRAVSPRSARLLRGIGPSVPRSYGYATEQVQVGDGRIGPVDEEVWNFSVSGYRVLPMWLRRRIRPRKTTGLDAIGLEQWTPDLTRELLELIWLLEATVQLGPALDEALDAVVSGSYAQLPEQQLAHAFGSKRTREDEALAVVAPQLLESIPL